MSRKSIRSSAAPAFIRHLKALGFDPKIQCKNTGVIVNEQTFTKHTNIKAFEIISHFLFLLLDEKNTKSVFEGVWPVKSVSQSRKYRQLAFNWLRDIQPGSALMNVPLRRSYLNDCHGEPLNEIFLAFTVHVLNVRRFHDNEETSSNNISHLDTATAEQDLSVHCTRAKRTTETRSTSTESIRPKKLKSSHAEAQHASVPHLTATPQLSRINAKKTAIKLLETEKRDFQRIENEIKEDERREAERRKIEREAEREAERAEAAKIKAELLESRRREAERWEARRIEAKRREDKREFERREADRKEAEERKARRVEAERWEARRCQVEKGEAERWEDGRTEAGRTEAKRIEKISEQERCGKEQSTKRLGLEKLEESQEENLQAEHTPRQDLSAEQETRLEEYSSQQEEDLDEITMQHDTRSVMSSICNTDSDHHEMNTSASMDSLRHAMDPSPNLFYELPDDSSVDDYFDSYSDQRYKQAVDESTSTISLARKSTDPCLDTGSPVRISAMEDELHCLKNTLASGNEDPFLKNSKNAQSSVFKPARRLKSPIRYSYSGWPDVDYLPNLYYNKKA